MPQASAWGIKGSLILTFSRREKELIIPTG